LELTGSFLEIDLGEPLVSEILRNDELALANPDVAGRSPKSRSSDHDELLDDEPAHLVQSEGLRECLVAPREISIIRDITTKTL